MSPLIKHGACWVRHPQQSSGRDMYAVQLLEGAVTKMPESDVKGVWRECGLCIAFSPYH